MSEASSSKKTLKSIFKAPKAPIPPTKRISRDNVLLPRVHVPPAPVTDAASVPRTGEAYGGFEMPIELLMTILDFVRDDKETIRHCCVVSRSWLPCARYFLISNDFTINERNMCTLFSLLASPFATIGSYITHLTIQTRQISIFLDYTLTFVADEASSKWMRPALDVLACLQYISPSIGRALRSLTIRDIGSLSRTDFGALCPVLREFVHLTRLELSHCLAPTIDALFAVVCARPSLQRLALTNILIGDPDAEPAWPPARLPRRLAHIAIQTAHQSDILVWIMAQPVLPAFSVVSLGGIGQTEWDRDVTNRFLVALGPHLKHLKLYLSNWKEVTLAHNTSLQTLSVSRYSLVAEKGPDGDITFDSFPGLLNMLDQIAAPHISHISLRFINNPEDIDWVPWGHIGRLFRHPKFERLKALRIRCVGRSAEAMQELLRASFPASLSRKGILRFQCDSHDSDS